MTTPLDPLVWLWDDLCWPTVQNIFAAETHQTLGTVRQEVFDRFKQHVPVNHDIQRAIRVAQLQAHTLHFRAYQARVRLQEPLDGDDGKAFERALANGLNQCFIRRMGVVLDEHKPAEAVASLSADVQIGAGATISLDRSDLASNGDAELLGMARSDLQRITGWAALPPGFEALLDGADARLGRWPNTYRALLCEQVKVNPRFRDILQTSTLLAIRDEQGQAFAALTTDIESLRSEFGTRLDEGIDRLRNQFGGLGTHLRGVAEQLSSQGRSLDELRVSVGAVENRLAELVTAAATAPSNVGAALQNVLDQSLEYTGRNAFLASEAVVMDRLRPSGATVATPLFGRDADLEALDGFLDSRDRGLLVLLGDAGVGKSRLLAEWSIQLTSPSVTVLRYFFSTRNYEYASEQAPLLEVREVPVAAATAQPIGPCFQRETRFTVEGSRGAALSSDPRAFERRRESQVPLHFF